MVLQLLGDETLAARWREIPDALADLLLPGLTAGSAKERRRELTNERARSLTPATRSDEK